MKLLFFLQKFIASSEISIPVKLIEGNCLAKLKIFKPIPQPTSNIDVNFFFLISEIIKDWKISWVKFPGDRKTSFWYLCHT